MNIIKTKEEYVKNWMGIFFTFPLVACLVTAGVERFLGAIPACVFAFGFFFFFVMEEVQRQRRCNDGDLYDWEAMERGRRMCEASRINKQYSEYAGN